MPKSTHSKGARKHNKPKGKVQKPRADFPLFPHASGRWAKKVRGRFCYFGKCADDPDGELALRLWAEQKDELLAGVPQPQVTGNGESGLPLHKLVNDFLNDKRALLDAGEITPRTFGEYHSTALRVVEVFGRHRLVASLTAVDFGKLRSTLAETRGPVTLGNEIQRVRMIFKWGYDAGHIDQPIRYGQSFKKPAAKVIRKNRAATGSRMFEAEELRRILTVLDGEAVTVEGEDDPVSVDADPALRAMVLLAINCGYGQSDVANLPKSALDLDGGWATFPRPKTGVERRAKLWPETVAAVNDVLQLQREARAPEDAALVFLTAKGKRWIREVEGEDPSKWAYRTDILGKSFARVVKRIGINGRRGFYAIRHSFQTVAEESRDMPAVKHAMGHSDSSMSGVYRDRISDERLEAVAETVHAWLFGGG